MNYIKSIVFFQAIVFSMVAQPAFCQSSRFSSNKYIDGGDTLNYRQLYPDADTLRKYPLVIFLHGSGERGHDNEAQLKWGVMNFATDQNMMLHPAFVIAPQCPEKLSWSNFSREKNSTEMRMQVSPTKPMELLIGLIHQLIKTLPVDTNRIYITGLSMGGYGTYDAIERYPHLFAAAVPVCGGGDVSKAGLIAHLPIWIFFFVVGSVPPFFFFFQLWCFNQGPPPPPLIQNPQKGRFFWRGPHAYFFLMVLVFLRQK